MINTINRQKEYFLSGETLPYAFRRKQLQTLQDAIKKYEHQITTALQADLGKSAFESYATEISIVKNEITHTLKRLKKWMKGRKVPPTISGFGGSAKVHFQPLGVVLIMAPWNYPFQLTLAPLTASLAAGNCAVLKPSRHSPNTARVLAQMINKYFDSQYISLFQGGRNINAELLKIPFDHIFFTGSAGVGKIVMEAAAKHLTPVTLELGGKCPCLVDKSADIEKTAKRIIWGKSVNSGQTCVAPDYVLVHNSVRPELIPAMKKAIKKFFGQSTIQSDDFGKIINEKAYDRLISLLQNEKIITGGYGDCARKKIELTLLDNPSLTSPVMKEEIFGPILPVIPYNNLSDAVKIIRSYEKPLALYLFTRDKKLANWVVNNLLYGGGCINDTVMHVANCHLPFGGVGASGIGAYHGERGFQTFSHGKSILKQTLAFDLPLRYAPYKNKLRLLKKIL